MKPIKPAKSKSPPQKEVLPAINTKKDKSPKESPSPSPVPGQKNQSKTIKENNSKDNAKAIEEPLIPASQADQFNAKPKKDMKKIHEDYKKRIKIEKEQEKKDRELFEKILSEAKSNNFKSQSVRTTLENQAPPIKITEKKAQAILENGGMLDAYKCIYSLNPHIDVIACLCKNGLPTGNLFEYSAYLVQGYEKKWKEKKSKETKKKLEQYWNSKEIEMLGKLNEEGEKNKLNRSLEEREMNKYIRTLDRSRSTKKIREPRSLSRTRDLEKLTLPKDSQKIVSVQQQSNERLETSGTKKDRLDTSGNRSPKTGKNKEIVDSSGDKSAKGNAPAKEKESLPKDKEAGKKSKEPPTGKKQPEPKSKPKK